MKLAREKHGSPAAAADAVTAAVADTVVAARVASEEDTNGPQLTFLAGHWAGLDSNQRRRKASRFTVCPVWPLRYLPFWREGFHISSRLTACNSRQLSRLLIGLT